TRELQGKCNQSSQQYCSKNSISPKPATKRFLIFRIELSIFVDDLSAHRTPSYRQAYRQAKVARADCGDRTGEMCVNYFTLRASSILMETIKDLYKRLLNQP